MDGIEFDFFDWQDKEAFIKAATLINQQRMFFRAGEMISKIIEGPDSKRQQGLYQPRFILIASINDLPLGCICVYTHGVLLDLAYEVNVSVKANYRRFGLASSMLEEFCKQSGVPKSRMYNRGSIIPKGDQFFVKHGIRLIGVNDLVNKNEFTKLKAKGLTLEEITDKIFSTPGREPR